MMILMLLCLALPAVGADVQQRIVGGDTADIANFPHQLSLRENGAHVCGASLISSTRAVTGAQCTGAAIGTYTILGGTAERTVTNCATCVVRDVNLLVRNPFYDADGAGIPNDIAVVGFPPLTFNENLDAINLATPEGGDFASASCVITGWGQASAGGNIQDELEQADVTVLTNTECEATWGNRDIAAGHICFYQDGATACTGDGGGPLECGDTLAGVLSWGEENCNPSYPYVASRVSYFYAWIIAQ